jgi:signal transduction histidine kinase
MKADHDTMRPLPVWMARAVGMGASWLPNARNSPLHWRGSAMRRGGRPQLYEMVRTLNALRVVQSVIALLLVIGLPAVDPLLVAIAYAFLVYGGVMFWTESRRGGWLSGRELAWLDAIWCATTYFLAGGDGGTIALLFFPVVSGAIRAGILDGVLIALASGLIMATVTFLHVPPQNWSHLAVPAISVMALTPIVAAMMRSNSQARGGSEFARTLLENLDPRRGIEQVASMVLERVGSMVEADVALLAVWSRESTPRVFYWEAGEKASELSEAGAKPFARELLAIPSWMACRFGTPNIFERLFGMSGTEICDLVTGEMSRERLAPAPIEALRQLLKQSSILVVPAGRQEVTEVRMLVARQGHWFEPVLGPTLYRVLEPIVPVFQNAQLLGELVADATRTERERIGRDLHDSAAQQYLGLKLGIEALARRVPEGDPLANDMRRLAQLAGDELTTLRRIAHGMRLPRCDDGDVLATAIRRHAQQFGELFGIEVAVTVDDRMVIDDEMSGELFHMVAEALGNIRRHTDARRASVKIAGDGGNIVLEVFNERGAEDAPKPFRPRSLFESAEARAGAGAVRIDAHGTTVTLSMRLSKEGLHERC